MNKTMRDMMAARREDALTVVQKGIENGSLRVRQMTPEERLRHAPHPRSRPGPGPPRTR